MGLMAKDTGGSDFTLTPQGTHIAICNMVVDLGHQKTTYQGQSTVKRQCYVRWELPNERVEYQKDGANVNGPMSIGKTYTLSLSEKANLRKDLESWRGKQFTPQELDGFDLFNLLGVPCQVTVTHDTKGDKTYANVKSVAGLPKGMPKPNAAENDLLKYCDDEQQDFSKLPEWLRKKIMDAADPAEHGTAGDPGAQHHDGPDLDDEIPF